MRSLVAAVAVGAGAVAAYGDEPPSQPPGPAVVVTATLISPHGAEGAAILDVAADAVVDVSMAAGSAFTAEAGDRLRIVLVRTTAGNIRAEIGLRDASADLEPRVVQVAGPSNELRADPVDYRVEVER
ncbi:MAG: hypothetical protein ACOC8B_07000 [Gemmatimonadota bacterium]